MTFWIIAIGITVITLKFCYMITDYRYFNAEQSRKDSDASRIIKIDSQIKLIRERIKEASKEGKYFIEINEIRGAYNIEDENKEKLIQLGYKVETIDPVKYRPYYKIRISWEKK